MVFVVLLELFSFCMPSFCMDNQVYLWKTLRDSIVCYDVSIESEQAAVHSLQMSCDGMLFLRTVSNQSCKLYSRMGLLLQNVVGSITSSKLSPDDSFFVTTSYTQGKVGVYKLFSPPAQTETEYDHDNVKNSEIAPDGSYVITWQGWYPRTVKVWKEAESCTLDHDGVMQVDISADGSVFASFGEGKCILFSSQGERLKVIEHRSIGRFGGRLSPDGKFAVFQGEGSAVIYSLISGFEATIPVQPFDKISISPDSKTIVVCDPRNDGRIHFYSPEGALNNSLENQFFSSFSADGSWFVTHSYREGTISFWTLAGQKIAVFEHPHVQLVALSRDGLAFVSESTTDGTVKTWSLHAALESACK